MVIWRTGIFLLFFAFCLHGNPKNSSEKDGLLPQEKGIEAITPRESVKHKENAKPMELEKAMESISPMEVLDKVKAQYASNFIKVQNEDGSENYYYRLETIDYYLVYEGLVEDDKYYLIHLYEFVLDDPDTGIGHTVTYGWYAVDVHTGEVEER